MCCNIRELPILVCGQGFVDWRRCDTLRLQSTFHFASCLIAKKKTRDTNRIVSAIEYWSIFKLATREQPNVLVGVFSWDGSECVIDGKQIKIRFLLALFGVQSSLNPINIYISIGRLYQSTTNVDIIVVWWGNGKPCQWGSTSVYSQSKVTRWTGGCPFVCDCDCLDETTTTWEESMPSAIVDIIIRATVIAEQ